MTTSEDLQRVEGYERFFGLNEAPFSLAPNPRFLFESASHAAALAQVAYAIERREPVVVITGEIGAGKTLLCRTVLNRLERKTFVSVVNDPLLGRDDLLKQLLQDFGVISKDRSRLTPTSRHDLMHALQDFLASLVPLQAHAVVIIDEAQHLQPDVLEQIRLLSNIDDERGTMLQIILVGQTDLEPLLSRPELRQFQQRVSRRFRLEPLNADEVQQYIEHRLAVARGDKTVSHAPGARKLEAEMAEWRQTPAGVTFTPDAIAWVSKLSGGLPRLINIICDRALEAAYAARLRTIDAPLIDTAARVVGLSEQAAPMSASANQLATPFAETATFDDPIEPVIAPPAAATPTAAAAANDSILRPEALEHPDETVLVVSGTHAEEPAQRGRRKGLAVAASLILAGGVIWFGARAVNRPAEPERQPPTPAATAPTTPSASAPAPPAQTVPVPAPASAIGTAVPADQTASSGAAAAATSGNRFEIVIASFRTDARAASVAAEVAALGLPTRRRTSAGWQQVLAGPFASRAQADEAQQRLDRAGLTGGQIVPSIR